MDREALRDRIENEKTIRIETEETKKKRKSVVKNKRRNTKDTVRIVERKKETRTSGTKTKEKKKNVGLSRNDDDDDDDDDDGDAIERSTKIDVSRCAICHEVLTDLNEVEVVMGRSFHIYCLE